MATIRDVAKAAGVSTATVSNVLNGRSEKVGSETRRKVLAAVRLLKYRLTPLEQNQNAILSKNVGVVVPDLTEAPLNRQYYFRNILDGALETVALRGWSITIFAQTMWDEVGHAVRRSYDGRCDGLIIVAPQPGNEVVNTLYERGTPIVLIGTTPWLPNVSCVDVDNAAIGAMAAQHLIDLNHRRLAYIGLEREQVSSKERREAFCQEARRWLHADHVQQIALPWLEQNEDVGERATDALLSLHQVPTGLFCWHDGLCVPLAAALLRRGFHVPRDFSLLSVDDSPEASTSIPPLTTFRNPVTEIGKRAAKLLIDRLDDGADTAEAIRFGAQLVIRGSTGPAKI